MFESLLRSLCYMRQNPWLALMATATVTVAMTLLTLFALTVNNAKSAVHAWSRDLQIVIYVGANPSPALARQWQTALASMAEVERVTFVGSDEALQRFRQRLGSDADLVAGVPASALPASLELTLRPEYRTQAAIAALAERLRQNRDWNDLQYGRDWVERFDAAVRLLRLLGTALGGFLLFATLFIVANTVRLTLLARRDEVEIMRLVGATPLYVHLPFLWEGALQGAAGGVAALALAYGLFVTGVQQGLGVLLHTVGVEQIVFLPLHWQGAVVGVGTLIGLLGSLAAQRGLARS